MNDDFLHRIRVEPRGARTRAITLPPALWSQEMSRPADSPAAAGIRLL